MIRTKRFFEFVNELVAIRNEELDEQASWEFWLHKDFERSFSEFIKDKEDLERSSNVSESSLINIVNESNKLIFDFDPSADG